MRAHQYQWVILQAGLALATGCAAQVDGDYRGESLGSVAGTVDFEGRPAAQNNTAIALLWDITGPGGGHAFDLSLGEFVDAPPPSPARFRINFLQRPAPEQLLELVDGNALAVARILWVGSVMGSPGTGTGFEILGTSPSHVMVYVRDDVAAFSEAAAFLHSTPASGYHIYEVYRPEPVYPCGTYGPEDDCNRVTSTCVRDVLLPAPEDLQTLVAITPYSGTTDFVYEDLEKVCVLE